MSNPISSTNYSIGMPDVYFDNTGVTNNTVTTTTANSCLRTLLNAIAVDGSTAARALYSLGNLSEASLTPEYSTLDHFISVNGSRLKDKTIITEKNLSINLTFDELNMKNLERFLMATDDDSTAAAVMDTVAPEGSAVLVYNSAYGTSFFYAIPRCTLTANGDLAFSGENWITGGLKLSVLALTGFNPTALAAGHGTLPVGLTSAPYGWIQNETSFGTFYYTTG
jgi:hypothetical protein